jgi:superfamily II DNA or RNA helicase
MGLRDLPLPPSIDTSHDEIAREFYGPALKSAVRYERAVGYFTSGWFRINARGMADFASRGGRARWIISPILNADDYKALEEGYNVDRIIISALGRGVAELERDLLEETRSTIAWLIADGVLDFRIAIPCGKLEGDFHVKFGIFYDVDGSIVSFDGSQNETEKGFQNYESLKIFWNWDNALAVYVESDVHRFERLWNDRDPNVRIHLVPEAIRQRLVRLRILARPYDLPFEKPYEPLIPTPEASKERPWLHQERAVSAWENNGRQGILVMATGTGKTRTALTALCRVPLLKFILIVVPTQTLAKQWCDVLVETRPEMRPLPIMEDAKGWLESAYRQLVLKQGSDPGTVPAVFVGTYHSIAGPKFQSLLHRVELPSDGTLLIADEVHNAGAPVFRKALNPKFQFRLGLTATLERAFDPEGTRLVEEYFKAVVFEFDIAAAIQAGVLCPYEYHPLLATLDDDELDDYDQITTRIARLIGHAEGPDDALPVEPRNSAELEQLYFQRANIIKKCKDKTRVLMGLLQRLPVQKALIYCADFHQVDEVEGILKAQGVPWLRFSSLESLDTRERALDLLKQGVVKALVSINCLDEGVDIPDVREAIFMASGGNPRQFVQRRGRLLRRFPGKAEALLHDILASPPPHPRYRLTPMLSAELRRATVLARSAHNSDAAIMQLLSALAPFGVQPTDLLL